MNSFRHKNYLVRHRIAEREAELVELERRLLAKQNFGTNEPSVSKECISEQIKELGILVSDKTEYAATMKQELRNLFPEGQIVSQEETSAGYLFMISGTAKPFAIRLLPTSIMSHSGAGT